MPRITASIVALALAGGTARAQEAAPAVSPEVRAAMAKALSKPSQIQMMPEREGELPAPPARRGFSLTDGVNTPVTFLVVPNGDSKATVADRRTLASGQSAMYGCGQETCYVRYAARGAVQAVQVTQGRAYRFQFLNGRFDLYGVDGPN